MSIQLGGISFSINLDMPGNPAQRIANLAASLANLQQVASSLSLTALQTALRGLGAVGFQGLVASIDRLNLGLRQNTHATLANSQATRQATTATQVQAQATLAAGAAFQQATAQMRNMANASANAANQAHKLQGGFSSAAGAVASFAGVFSGLRLGDWLKDVTLYAGRVENLGTVLRQVGANAHYSTGELAAIEDRVKALGITTQAARQSLTLMARNEMDLKQGGPLARIAQDAAVIAGNNSSEAFEKITLAIQRLDTRMMRNQGILVNLNQEYARFARETGRAATTLTAHEKQQIMLNAVLRAGVNTCGTYEAAMNDAYKQFTSLQRYQEEAMRVAGEQLQGVFSQAVIGATEALKWFTALDENTQRLIVTGAAMGAAFLSAAGAIGACAIAIGALGSAATPVLGIAALLATLAGEYVFLESAAAGVTQRFEKIGRAHV